MILLSGMSGLYVRRIVRISNKGMQRRMVIGFPPVRYSSLLDTPTFYWTYLSSTISWASQ